ncbi:MAG TPA: ABC transporter ATP-binding protein [Alphaproteobacteria bacterium]|nr:ABC transporter ATP-binding protein [Alphaproteobacteria bacterium]
MEHVSHSYEDGTQVLNDISFSVARGEIFSLSGPSGCGKTTTLRLVAGLETLSQGRIVIDGRVVADKSVHIPPEQRKVGLVFQDMALFPHLSVRDNIAFGIPHLSRGEREARVNELLAQVSMSGYGEAYPHRLSGGQQQRVALARALAPDPPLLLLDEPFSGLDPRLRITIREDTLNILKQRGTTTLIVTHDPEEAMYVSDTMAVMRDGRIEQIGNPGDLYCRPVTPYVALFFSAANLIRGVVENGHVATPFGPIPAPALKDGQRAVVLMRPESLVFDPLGGPPPATTLGSADGTVISARMLRHTVVIRMDFGEFNGERLSLRVRSAGHFMPEEGARIRVALDPAQTFVFPIRKKGQKG